MPELLLVIFDECPHGLVLAKKRSDALVLVLNDAADMVDCLSHLGHLLLLIVEMLLDGSKPASLAHHDFANLSIECRHEV